MKVRVKARKSPSRGAAKLACMILAAGKGTRMRSNRAKVLHTLLGRPMICYPIDQARSLGADPVVTVLGHQLAEVKAVIDDRFGAGAVRVAEQHIQRGTGHAVKAGLAALRGFDGLVVILVGDAPLLETSTLKKLIAAAQSGRDKPPGRKGDSGSGVSQKDGGMAVLTARVSDPTGYGRIVRDAEGRAVRIVEHKDASAQEQAINEINSGIYVVPADLLRHEIPRLSSGNTQGEFYLTDIVEQAARTIGVTTVVADADEIAGINDRVQLVDAEMTLRQRINRGWARHATIRGLGDTDIEPDVIIEADAEIDRFVSLRGKTRIGAGARIGQGSVLVDTIVGADAEIKPYCSASQAVIGAGCKIGPYAHLRPGTDLGEDVHIGNFVETKKARFGKGSKANHLSYLGDAVIGRKVNVGAGTITCNYNGYEKQVTEIEDGAFIGSDTQLVAPVRVGAGAVVAAGTTVTRNVPGGALAISRVEQVHKEGYAERVAARYPQKNQTPKAPGKQTNGHQQRARKEPVNQPVKAPVKKPANRAQSRD